MSSVVFDTAIEWDGKQLSAEARVNSRTLLCVASRAAIHQLRPYDDAISREIAQARAEIFEKLKPIFIAKILASALVSQESKIEIYEEEVHALSSSRQMHSSPRTMIE